MNFLNHLYKSIKRIVGFSVFGCGVFSSPALSCEALNTLESSPKVPLYVTQRLIAHSPDEAGIAEMANILNQPVANSINGMYYEDGKNKDDNWIKHKKKLILEDKLTTCHFFYHKDSPLEIVSIVGIEPDFEGPEILKFFYLANSSYQGQGYTTEAVQGFLSAMVGTFSAAAKEVVLSIHPDNKGSIAIAKKIHCTLVAEDWNFAKTQRRHMYSVSIKDLTTHVQSFPAITLIGQVFS